MDPLRTVLDVAVIAFGAVAAAVTLATAARYREPRFYAVGVSLAVLGAIGAVGLADLLWSGSIPDADLTATPAALLVVAEAIFYLSLVAGRHDREREPSSET
ncbi:MAG: hypothetical protein KGJ23_13920 [Euryarchaeota archaeon]|nr:hypothetical protein [Euryarchaeota archaeon]MDE1837695.1 hypothetical protein [Euryarchaeota archaeon]MDE1882279.1 hypothetical protein [Euryarchaeota archaeon]MDE2045975.1 hypothetical protein [Thermoplasmata archaeon]